MGIRCRKLRGDPVLAHRRPVKRRPAAVLTNSRRDRIVLSCAGDTPEAPAVEGDNHEPSARDADRFPESHCRPLEELERRHKECHIHRAVTERQRVTVSENYGQPRMPAVQLREHLR